MLRQPLLTQKLGPSLGAKVRSGSDVFNGLCLHTLPWIIAVSETQHKDSKEKVREKIWRYRPAFSNRKVGAERLA